MASGTHTRNERLFIEEKKKTTNAVDKRRMGRCSLPSSSCLRHPLSLVHPYEVIADRQGGRSNDASSVNQAISFLRDWNEDSAGTTIDFPSPAVIQLSQLPREYEEERKVGIRIFIHFRTIYALCRCQGKRKRQLDRGVLVLDI